MAVFKCKMCGGALEINSNETVAVCEYCGTKQTLPKLTDERKANLYDRANHFRRNNEFDKAMSIYESILNDDKTDAESYWSLVLCRYGIEYVEDPASKKRIPTVNRAQYTSIFMDEDYKSAIEYADGFQKDIYESEAKAIDEIQKGILEISQKEEPFDVFICYKESDSNGRRTPDSVLATELYHELGKEGFKVFFSRITLEDKLGTAYEPYIFAALNSAKVMVVLGTKQEYFNAVWVKNEWSRYLALIKNGARKTLIPAYKDMDPYDLPEEFSHLQAQDMTKLGFMQDLVRGIRKIAGEEEKPAVIKETVVTSSSASTNTAPLLERAFMFLEDGDWESADEYCEKVLDLEPKNAQAYLGKLMADLRIKKQDNLKNCAEPFDGNSNYQKAVRFADDELNKSLTEAVKFIKDRNEENRCNKIYTDMSNVLKTESSKKLENASYQLLTEAEKAFLSIANYKDSSDLAKKCSEKAKEVKLAITEVENAQDYATAIQYKKTNVITQLKKARLIFDELGDYKDSKEKSEECLRMIYDKAIGYQESSESSMWVYALSAFNYLEDYKDSVARKGQILKKQKEKEEKTKILIKKALIIGVSSLIGLIILGNIISSISDFVKYKQALKLAEAGDYSQAIFELSRLDGYKDSEEQIDIIYEKQKEEEAAAKAKAEEEQKEKAYNEAVAALAKGDKVKAAMMFGKLSGYKDAREKSFALWDEIAIRETVSVGLDYTVAIKSDGTVVADGYNENGACEVDDWTDIVAISAGVNHTVGLKSDGTVVAVGYNANGACEVDDWTDIVAISTGGNHTVGLKSDGTVVAVGSNRYGQCLVSDWSDVVAISANGNHTIGLKSDGTVIAVGNNEYGQCNLTGWKDIVAVSTGNYYTVGLKSDGTVVAVGNNDEGQCNVSTWTDIVAVFSGVRQTVGLKSDGTVVPTEYIKPDFIVGGIGDFYYDESDVNDWTDIVAVSAGEYHTVALKSDGTVVAVSDNKYGQCDVSEWKDIKIPENK